MSLNSNHEAAPQHRVVKAKRPHCLCFAAMLIGLAAAHADDVTPTVQNRSWGRSATTGTPTIGQFGGFSSVTSSATTKVGTDGRPKTATLTLQVSFLGASFSGGSADFAIGDVIGTPVATFTDAANREISLRRKPVTKTEAAFKYRLPGETTIRTFTPASHIVSERYYWSESAQFVVVPDAGNNYEVVSPNATAGVTRDGFVYASQGGSARIVWRTELKIADNPGDGAPVYGLIERTVFVTSSTRYPVRNIFWTDHNSKGPPVKLPSGEIAEVVVAHTDRFPATVTSRVIPAGVTDPNIINSITYNTLWVQNDELHAYNLEGRLMVEFLAEPRGNNRRRQVGVEVVDVIKEVVPADIRVPLGERLYPLPPDELNQQSYPLPTEEGQRVIALARIERNLSLFSAAPISAGTSNYTAFTRTFEVGGEAAYYATKETKSSSDVQFFWRETGLANIQWPKFLNRYIQYWPQDVDDYIVNIRPSDATQSAGTLPIFSDNVAMELVYQDDPNGQQAHAPTTGIGFEVTLTGSDPYNRSLLLIQNGTDFWFVRAESVLDSALSNPRYSAFYETGVSALVGSRIEPPAQADSKAGYVDFTKGDAIDESAYIDPFANGIPTAETGAIIPVNAAPRGGNKDKLAVWWLKKLQPPPHLLGKIDPTYWPTYYRTYQLAWPTAARTIVLASNIGSDDLPADAAAGSIYYQNDPSKRGYNPNEEHAQMLAGRAYALRDDLNNISTTSDDYVLVRYISAVDDRPAMLPFRVLRTDETYDFIYDAKAGTVLQPPMPLAIMPPPLQSDGTSRNTEVTPANLDPAITNAPAHYQSFTYEDRKGLKWLYRAQHNPGGARPSLLMKFYYATRDGFAYPNATTGADEAPPVATITPFLADIGADKRTGTSISIAFKPYWPDIGPSDGAGLTGQYYSGINLSGSVIAQRLDQLVNFTFNGTTAPAPSVPPTQFSARWTGFIIIPADGSYTFYTTGDEGERLWIEDVSGTPAINDWTPPLLTTEQSTPTYAFRAGQRVPVKLEYFNNTSGGNLSLSWEGPGIAKTLIPNSALSTTDRIEEVPMLQFAETLVKAKNGLPGLNNATSAKVLYQQSIARNLQSSATLHDATRRKTSFLTKSTLDKLPTSAATSTNQGLTYFQGLPPHLQQRFYFDPNVGNTNPVLGGLVLEGEFVDETVGESYLLPNILSFDDFGVLKSLVTATDPRKGAWDSAITVLSTRLETFIENTQVPGTYIPNPAANVTKTFGPLQLVEVTDDNQAVDSYALTAVGGEHGYVTLILGNGEAFTDESEPVQVQILRVGPKSFGDSKDDLYTGQVKPITPENPLSESLTLQHTGDFAGRTGDYEFEWYYAPPIDGQPPLKPSDTGVTSDPWQSLHAGHAENQYPRVTFGGSQPLLTLTDNYIIMRYRPKVGHVLRPIGSTWTDEQGWSAWTQPALAEGWIKRVLAGINPFNQRISDFFNNAVNTDVSLITQAGTRWEGDIPLTIDSAQSAGLIQIYETVLRRGIGFSIEGSPAINYGPANDALLLATGYLNDLYMALGNEAYSDASNPLISLDVDPQRLLTSQGLPASIGTTIVSTATARYAFEGQVPSLLDEELVLLRGRDDFLTPGGRVQPIYNRFFWNYTRGINAGEVIYALNYNIQEKSGPDADGKIDATDAARQYPQGHGDAYGHYLTALTNYYRLLSDANFTWTPRVEAVNILGVPVTVDYQDERRFATAAAALSRTSSRILDLARRKLPIGTDAGWADMRETKANASTGITRTWGVDHWAARSGQGNYVHWVVANAMLPENDVAHEGIQKIDRQNVSELTELASLGSEIQGHLDAANRHTNALNLSDDSIQFDLSPSSLAAGESHFDQILARAKAALANAATAHERTVSDNALLRTVENQTSDVSFTVSEQERAFNLRLYDIYGEPYAGDIGPGKLYPQGYEGPDFYHFMFIDRPYIYTAAMLFGTTPGKNDTRTLTVPIRREDYLNKIYAFDGKAASARALATAYVPYMPIGNGVIDGGYGFQVRINFNEGPYVIVDPALGLGRRNSTGLVQTNLAAVMDAREQLYFKLRSLDRMRTDFDASIKRFAADIEAKEKIFILGQTLASAKLVTEKAIGAGELVQELLKNGAKSNMEVAKAAAEAMPTVNGLANDTTSIARGAFMAQAVAANTVLDAKKIAIKVLGYIKGLSFDLAEMANKLAENRLTNGIDTRANVTALRDSYRAVFDGVVGVDAANVELSRALQDYRDTLVEGDVLQAERETFRKRAAAVVQGSRVRDVALRAFRTESLEQYKVLFDQAARYTFLAAKAYDYDTALLGNSAGRDFLSSIVATRALGHVDANGEPQVVSNTGDGGLSSLLAKLQADWNVAKGRLGINNPDPYGSLFSLRRECFNLPYLEDGSAEDHRPWQDKLRSCLVSDLRSDPAIATHALPTSNPSGLAQPGFIIDFSTTIEDGVNFFGKPLGAGDSTYSSASYSTKVSSVGIVFQGYIGMNPYASGNTGVPPAPNVNSPDALAATPYAYLIPAGNDSMRTPPFSGAASTTREWFVQDFAMPLPYDIGNSGFGQTTRWTSSTSLSEPFFTPRKHQPFRAVADPTLFYSTIPAEFTNRRLIGRSVWNSQWKLVIPAQTLLANPQDGIERFIRSVKDIKLFLRTYSNAGN